MKEAIEMWYRCQYTNDSLQFRDSCYSVHCHKYCPDKVDFLNNEPDRYPDWSIFAIIGIVAVIMVIAIAMKVSKAGTSSPAGDHSCSLSTLCKT